MFGTYLRRELSGRRRQTAIIAIGLALAIALVILVNSAAGGVKAAQTTALKSVYGVGTDITVTKAATAPSDAGAGRQSFSFGSGAGQQSGSTRTFGSTRLRTSPGTTAFTAADVTKAAGTSGVKAATGVLSLENISFSGQTPDFNGTRTGGTPGSAATPGTTGGPAGNGSSAFGIQSFTVLGYDVKGATIGPLTAATLTKGRTLTASDAGKQVALLDSDYATTAKKTVGQTISVDAKTFTIVGIVKSTSSTGATASHVYIPLDTAQKLASLSKEVSSVYVEAQSSSGIPAVQTALKTSLGSGMTVNSEADLASTVTGSVATAANLADSLGFWLSLLVLAAAFLIAVLFTISGVTRRTREFGTLKAIGWSNRRIVGQVAGESLVQGLIGGAIGIAVGVLAVVVINLIHPTLTAGAATTTGFGGFRAGGFGGAGGAAPGGAGTGAGTGEGFGGGFGRAATTVATAASQIALTLPISGTVIAIAVALAVLGGLVAGAFGGWRAARLKPAAALRSVA